MPRKESLPANTTAQSQQEAAMPDGLDTYELPKSLITRIAKSALPESAKLQKDTVTALVKGSTVFINYLAATAQDVAAGRSHKTISAADVLKALEMLEFGDMVPDLQRELEVYRAAQKGAKGRKSGASATATATAAPAKPEKKRGRASGKEKAVAGSPFTTAPLGGPAGAEAEEEEEEVAHFDAEDVELDDDEIEEAEADDDDEADGMQVDGDAAAGE